VRDSELDALLREWAQSILKEAEISLQPAWSKEVTVRATTIYVPNYWPNRRVWRLNEEIISLEGVLRDALAGKYIMNYSERRIAKELEVSRHKARASIQEARKKLRENLTNQPDNT